MTAASPQHTLVVEDLAKSFPTAGDPLIVLSELSLQLTAGDSVAIVGPSGSGKSTLLQILGTLDHPDSGTVSIDGVNPFTLDETELARFRNTGDRIHLSRSPFVATTNRRRKRTGANARHGETECR